METVKELSDGQRNTIGKTMVAAIAAKKKKYQIKQNLFRAVINWDTEFFVELAFAGNYFLEKPLISSLYHEWGMGSETEEEAIEIISQSEYLKHYPELKEEILKDVLLTRKSCAEAAEKYVTIRKGKSVRIIEKGVQIPDGWTLFD
jgi:hypothetical protein